MYSVLFILALSLNSPQGQEAFVRPLNVSEASAMENVTWHPGCPVPLEHLRRVEVPYFTPKGETLRGALVVHKDIAAEVGTIFAELHAIRFVIEEISPALTKHGKDDALMRSNVTSAFNCRPITGGKGFSRHSYGRAIDINPLWNPYIKGNKVLPVEAPDFARPPRDHSAPGMIYPGSPIVKIFKKRSWTWGGHWKRVKDYQHFESQKK